MTIKWLVGVVASAGVVLGFGGSAFGDEPGNKTVNEFSFTYEITCGEVGVLVSYAERVSELNTEFVVAHVTRTYTVEGDSLPFFRFVGSYVDRGFVDRDGDHMSTRRGLDEGFIGYMSINDSTGEEVWHGRGTPSPDELACGATG